MFPKLKWSDWFLWTDRTDLPGSHLPGIYRLAYGKETELNLLNGWSKVMYIGMTQVDGSDDSTKQTGLRQRWNQFNNRITGKTGHSGGKRVYEEYGAFNDDNNKFPKMKNAGQLFVSAMPINTFENGPLNSPDYIRACGLVCYMEYAAFSEFCEWTNLPRPKFNRK
jgi:hypothetical protein